jgi:uncharacterized protein YndB with AHSA1/START domain
MGPIEATAVWTSSCGSDAVWAALTDVGSYEQWWPWLERFEGPTPVVGVTQSAIIRAPAGYRVRYEVQFTEVDRPRRLATTISGDLAGAATIDLESTPSGTTLTFAWHLRAERRLLRLLGRIAAPVLIRGHDRIIERGGGQFVAGSGIDLRLVD